MDLLLKMPVSYEPKRKNRWLAKFPEEIGIREWAFDTTHRPIITVKDGKVNFEPITIKFRDPIGPSTSQLLMMLFDAQTFKEPTLFEKIQQYFKKEKLRKSAAMNYPKFDKFKDGFDYDLQILDPTGVVIELWRVVGCKIVSIDFGTLSYKDDQFADITMVIEPKFVQFVF